jgi:NAD/NADP transhydrogenase alpha subunit
LGLLGRGEDAAQMERYRSRRLGVFSLNALPRISRAQKMDALSSMAACAGYKAVLLAAGLSGKFFPLLMTAAGTVAPARVLVLGAGVAGLQAIATARRLGAVVEAFDVRPAVKEEVQSLGASFVEMSIGEAGVGAGGYAKELDEQRSELIRQTIAARLPNTDVIISTASIPGRRAPLLVSAEPSRDEAGLGDRGPRGRIGRQLRAHPARRDRARARREHRRAARHRGHAGDARQPDVRAQPVRADPAPCQGRQAERGLQR